MLGEITRFSAIPPLALVVPSSVLRWLAHADNLTAKAGLRMSSSMEVAVKVRKRNDAGNGTNKGKPGSRRA